MEWWSGGWLRVESFQIDYEDDDDDDYEDKDENENNGKPDCASILFTHHASRITLHVSRFNPLPF
jgi:hypothetical protein